MGFDEMAMWRGGIATFGHLLLEFSLFWRQKYQISTLIPFHVQRLLDGEKNKE